MQNNQKTKSSQFDFSPLKIKQPSVNIFRVIAAALAVVAVFLGAIFTQNIELIGALVPVIILVIFGSTLYAQFKLVQKMQATFREFAVINNLNFLEVDNPDSAKGSLFKHGHSKKLKNIVSGQLDDLPFRFFEYYYTKGYGKDSRTYDSTVLEITLPRNLPNMVIDSLVESGNFFGSTLPIQFDSSQKIVLEGDFNKYFALYAPDNYGITALSILAPDVMQALMQHAAKCDIEIIDNKLYFYWPDVSPHQDSVQEKFRTVEEVLKETSKKLTSSDVYATSTQKLLHSEAATNGQHLKMAWWSSPFMGIFVVFFLILYFFFLPLVPPQFFFLALIIYPLLGIAVARYLFRQYKQQKLADRFKNKKY